MGLGLDPPLALAKAQNDFILSSLFIKASTGKQSPLLLGQSSGPASKSPFGLGGEKFSSGAGLVYEEQQLVPFSSSLEPVRPKKTKKNRGLSSSQQQQSTTISAADVAISTTSSLCGLSPARDMDSGMDFSAEISAAAKGQADRAQ